ncbi:MAG: hypothetical protein J6Y62_05020 [Clostridia bacterium]|nr:hypothetical protein [Clostridia bacterium]
MPVDTTDRKGYNVVRGACFAYFDKEFPECLGCSLKEPCEKASSSEKAEEIRASVKNNPAEVKRWAARFK